MHLDQPRNFRMTPYADPAQIVHDFNLAVAVGARVTLRRPDAPPLVTRTRSLAFVYGENRRRAVVCVDAVVPEFVEVRALSFDAEARIEVAA